jgi:hypothetical protein
MCCCAWRCARNSTSRTNPMTNPSLTNHSCAMRRRLFPRSRRRRLRAQSRARQGQPRTGRNRGVCAQTIRAPARIVGSRAVEAKLVGPRRPRFLSISSRFGAGDCLGDVGGVRIRLCDADAGRLQSPTSERGRSVTFGQFEPRELRLRTVAGGAYAVRRSWRQHGR